jgi:hypothetical protein
MRIEGAIVPVGRPAFNREAWCALVTRRPEFRRPPPRQIRNPFTGESTTAQPPPDVAEVVSEGRVVGEVYWSMSEEPRVNVSVESSALPLVRECAAELGGEFQPEPSHQT